MVRIRRDLVSSLILAALRGFCLTPLQSPLAKGGLGGYVGISAIRTRSNTQSRLILVRNVDFMNYMDQDFFMLPVAYCEKHASPAKMV